MDFHTFIKAVGTGEKHNRDLTAQEMYSATCAMLDQSVYPEQISAFLLGWRIKPETTQEFIGCLNACESYVKKTPIKNAIDLGYPYDGKVNNPYLFSLIAKVLAPFDLNLIITGDKLQPAKAGITTKEICENITLDTNLHYFDRKNFFKELSDLSEIRMRLGLRTGFNTIEKLLNPANASYGLIGAFHKPYVAKYAQIFASRYEKFIVVQGNEGSAEIFSKCKYWICKPDDISEHYIDPKKYGITYQKSWDRISLEESLDAINNPTDGLIQLAKLNAAVYLYMSSQAKDIDEGWEMLL